MTNPRADRVSAVAHLAARSGRRRAGLFLVEGPQAVREAVACAAGDVVDLYVTERAADRWNEIVTTALAADLHVHPVTQEVAERMSRDAQGVLATLRLRERVLGELDLAALSLVSLCEEVTDPGNAGTIVRAADAAGADAVILTSGSVDVASPKVVRSSAGSLFHLPVVSGVALGDAIAALRSAGLTVLAADAGGSLDLETSPLVRGRVAWVLGNEARGLSPEARELADATVRIPLRGRAESLNVAMAATICLYASSRGLPPG